MWALIANPRRSAGNCSASRPLPTGCWGEPPIRDTMFGTAKVRKLVANAWSANPPPNRMPPMPEQATPRHDPGQARVAQLDHPRGERAERRQEGDGLDPDPVLVDDREVDQRQQDRLGVVDRVGDRQEPKRAHRADLVGRHGAMVPHRWPTPLGQSTRFASGACLRASWTDRRPPDRGFEPPRGIPDAFRPHRRRRAAHPAAHRADARGARGRRRRAADRARTATKPSTWSDTTIRRSSSSTS